MCRGPGPAGAPAPEPWLPPESEAFDWLDCVGLDSDDDEMLVPEPIEPSLAVHPPQGAAAPGIALSACPAVGGMFLPAGVPAPQLGYDGAQFAEQLQLQMAMPPVHVGAACEQAAAPAAAQGSSGASSSSSHGSHGAQRGVKAEGGALLHGASPSFSSDESGLTKLDKVERTKQKRRESAARSRARKNAYMHQLEVENAALRDQLERLKHVIGQLQPCLAAASCAPALLAPPQGLGA